MRPRCTHIHTPHNTFIAAPGKATQRSAFMHAVFKANFALIQGRATFKLIWKFNQMLGQATKNLISSLRSFAASAAQIAACVSSAN